VDVDGYVFLDGTHARKGTIHFVTRHRKLSQ
jgi:hypothetical protein